MKNLTSLAALFSAIFLSGNIANACAIAGPAGAPLTIEEFVDFECPYCAQSESTMKQVLANYPGKIQLVLHNMPLPFHTEAATAAKAFSAVCLQSPALAYSFQAILFENQAKLQSQGDRFLYDTASSLGVDVAQMKSDMNGPAVAQILADDLELFKTHGFKGTPSLIVGTVDVSGARSYADLAKIIDGQL